MSVATCEDPSGPSVRHAYDAETLSRLTALKDRCDPANVFHLNHKIAASKTGDPA